MPDRKYILPEGIAEKLSKLPETAMGSQTVSVWTKDGRRFDNVVVIDSKNIVGIYGFEALPFDPSDVSDVQVTHWVKPDHYNPAKMKYFDRD
jgi:hypothetical protein